MKVTGFGEAWQRKETMVSITRLPFVPLRVRCLTWDGRQFWRPHTLRLRHCKDSTGLVKRFLSFAACNIGMDVLYITYVPRGRMGNIIPLTRALFIFPLISSMNNLFRKVFGALPFALINARDRLPLICFMACGNVRMSLLRRLSLTSLIAPRF